MSNPIINNPLPPNPNKIILPKSGGPSLSDPAASTLEPPAASPGPVVDPNGIDILSGMTDQHLDTLSKLIEERRRAKTVAKDPARHQIDYKVVRESDIFNLDIPIEAISHDAADFMEVTLANPEYIARWVHKHPARIGTMKAQGFSFVQPSDLEVDLKLEIEVDENNHYKYIDTVLMKVPKIKYFGRLRKNFLRSKDAVSHKKHHERMRAETHSQIATMTDERPGHEGQSYGNDFATYNDAGKIKAYIPGAEL